EDEPLRHARQAADRGAGLDRPLLRADRPARALAEDGPGAVAAPRELPSRRRAARRRAGRAPRRPPLLRVPARELVLRRGVRAPAHARRRARDRRRSAATLPDARADRRLDVPPLPLGERGRQLHGGGARAVGAADRGLARADRRLRLLQQRPGGLRAPERSLARGAAPILGWAGAAADRCSSRPPRRTRRLWWLARRRAEAAPRTDRVSRRPPSAHPHAEGRQAVALQRPRHGSSGAA